MANSTIDDGGAQLVDRQLRGPVLNPARRSSLRCPGRTASYNRDLDGRAARRGVVRALQADLRRASAATVTKWIVGHATRGAVADGSRGGTPEPAAQHRRALTADYLVDSTRRVPDSRLASTPGSTEIKHQHTRRHVDEAGTGWAGNRFMEDHRPAASAGRPGGEGGHDDSSKLSAKASSPRPERPAQRREGDQAPGGPRGRPRSVEASSAVATSGAAGPRRCSPRSRCRTWRARRPG